MGILVQNLLPRGSPHERERQFFLIGEMAGRFLREIGQLLATTYQGVIPTVFPYRNNKAEDLLAEPSLFQWAATNDGSYNMLRFLFYGLALTIRHVMAIRTRTVENQLTKGRAS
ncbi:MAG TPA: hypothetical protein VFV38_21440 [Ktedonobacteraceae bacterium]|nr:hypothetical protein [Ktedonobacteraceae bacterium]